MPRCARFLVLCCAVSLVAAAPPSAPRDEQPVQAKQQAQGEASRVARRDRHRAILAALWGPVSAEPAGLAEFDLHAWRMARLRRMERLASELARPALLDQITALLAKEQARHLKHMKRLQSTAPSALVQSSPTKQPAARKPARKD